MRISIESTNELVGESRLWIGFTESGIPVSVIVSAVSPVIAEDDPRHEEFKHELTLGGRISAEHGGALLVAIEKSQGPKS